MKRSDLNQLFSLANGWNIESFEDALYEFRPDHLIDLDSQDYLLLIRRSLS